MKKIPNDYNKYYNFYQLSFLCERLVFHVCCPGNLARQMLPIIIENKNNIWYHSLPLPDNYIMINLEPGCHDSACPVTCQEVIYIIIRFWWFWWDQVLPSGPLIMTWVEGVRMCQGWHGNTSGQPVVHHPVVWSVIFGVTSSIIVQLGLVNRRDWWVVLLPRWLSNGQHHTWPDKQIYGKLTDNAEKQVIWKSEHKHV